MLALSQSIQASDFSWKHMLLLHIHTTCNMVGRHVEVLL